MWQRYTDGNTYTNNLNTGGGALDVRLAARSLRSRFVNLASPGSGGNFALRRTGSPAIGAGASTNAPKVDITVHREGEFTLHRRL